MKKVLNIVNLSVFSIVISIVLVENTSMPKCNRCVPRMCFYQRCNCGYYMDYCNCCPICYKCPGERCSLDGTDRCMRGSRCMGLQDANYFTAYNYGGQCL